MRNNIIFKVALPGEGKTKWLLDVAHQYSATGRSIYLYTEDETEYAKFCEKYFAIYKAVCPVYKLTAFKITKDAVILIDNLLSHGNSLGDIRFFQRNCYKMFVTLEGEQQDIISTTEENN